MKLNAVLAAIAPFMATDKKPEEIRAAIIAADKSAKDAFEIEKKDQAAKDKAAKDKAAKDEAEAKEKKEAEDKAAKDKKDDDGNDPDSNDENPDMVDDEDPLTGADPSTPGGSRAGGKTAIDSAEVDKRIAAAVAARDALHEALRDVEPVLGKVTFDSAPKAYKAALDHLKVDTSGVKGGALRAMFRLAKDKATAPALSSLAMDNASVSAIEKVIPGYGRLR